ncbi:MAG: hypothetical protein K1X55_10570 [Chitinophagales bacterium]|nr:hypothetical protein [Chitinophagales bacterium]
MPKNYSLIIVLVIIFFSCKKEKPQIREDIEVPKPEKPVIEGNYNFRTIQIDAYRRDTSYFDGIIRKYKKDDEFSGNVVSFTDTLKSRYYIHFGYNYKIIHYIDEYGVFEETSPGWGYSIMGGYIRGDSVHFYMRYHMGMLQDREYYIDGVRK